MTLLIGLDLGTTTIKAAAYDPDAGQVAGIATRPTPVTHPVPGYSEHDPEALWQTVTACLRELKERHPDRAIAGLAMASFAEAGLPLDAAGEPLYPIIAWYDRRCELQAAWWEAQMPAAALHAITGQRVSPSFGVNRWLWLKANLPEVAARMARWLSASDYILWRLTGRQGAVTDYSVASRTLLFDQQRLAWSAEMLKRAGLAAEQLPEPRPGGTLAGALSAEAAAATGLPAGTPCILGGHDHLCAAFAAGAYAAGSVVDSCGTAEAVLAVVPGFHSSAFIAEAGYACYAHVLPGHYILKGGLKAAGGAVEWLARQLAGPDAAGELPYAELEAAAGDGAGRRAGPLWLPHLIGSGTPEGDRHSMAALVGARAEHNQGDLFRGLLESLAFWLRQNMEAIQDLTGLAADEVILLGGTVRLHLLAQLKAEVLGQPVTVPELPEAAATGAALLAGLGTGVFAGPAEAVASLRYGRTIIKPDAGRIVWYNHLYREAYRPLYAALQTINHSLAAIDVP